MASPTRKLKRMRKAKESKAGRNRKSKLRNQGTTRSASELFGDDKN